MADKDLAKLIVLTPTRKNGLDGKSGSHGHHVGSALTESLRLFDEVFAVHCLQSYCMQLVQQHCQHVQFKSYCMQLVQEHCQALCTGSAVVESPRPLCIAVVQSSCWPAPLHL